VAPESLVEARGTALGPQIWAADTVEVLSPPDHLAPAAVEGPVTDRVSVSTWDWPEMQHLAPAPAVQLSGIIAPARHWRTGLTGAAPFAGLCPTALLLPAHIARNVECLTHAEYYGPTVLAAAGPDEVDPDAVDVVHVGRSRVAANTPRTPTSRWVHEMVYDRMLALL
jgi:hypothetical protein